MKKLYYFNKISILEKDQKDLLKKIRNISLLRLLIMILGLFGVYWAFAASTTIGLISLLILIAVFTWIVRNHNKVYRLKEKTQNLLSIYKNEIELFSSSNMFGDGENYNDPKHEYSSDLDVFGKYSLFNLINRTATYQGENLLANWLKKPLGNYKLILEKQEIVKELEKKDEFKEQFLSTLFLAEKTEQEASKIQNWVSVFRYYFTEKNILRVILFVLSILTVLSLLTGFVYPQVWNYSFVLLMINYLLAMKYKKPVDLVHEHISKQGKLFNKYSKLVKIIKKEEFNSAYLNKLKEKLLGENQIEKQLKLLSKLIKNLDYRLNIIVASVLNLLFFWDIHYTYRVEKWMKDNSSKIGEWLEIIGEFDALLSMSILKFNNSDWIFPEISTGDIVIDGKNIGHPLIDHEQRVLNDYSINGKGKFDIVTGSNMAGKSTFLRTIGINTILALNGFPVCAKSFTVSNIQLITYMRITDSLEDNLSTFHAELERIKSILNYVEENENCFLLLDELLRGTNSQDRHVGTVALIKQLMQNKSSGINATHDLALTDMILEFPENIRNYNFGVKTKDNDLFFDYKLTHGVCDSFNASLLMKKIGIKIEMI